MIDNFNSDERFDDKKLSLKTGHFDRLHQLNLAGRIDANISVFHVRYSEDMKANAALH